MNIFRINFAQALLCAFVMMGGSAAFSAPLFVNIQPIQVCDDLGNNCAEIPGPSTSDFADATDLIFAQPGLEVTVNVLQATQFNSSQYLVTSSTESNSLLDPFATDTNRHLNNLVLNMWFVEDLHNDTAGTTFGLALVGGNGIIINDAIFGTGRLDTIAHEIGHNLGLDHASALGDNNNLMQSGGSRNTPSVLGDITTDGVTGVDVLNGTQIATALGSQFITADAIPAPGMLVLFGLGSIAIIGTRRRRHAALAA